MTTKPPATSKRTTKPKLPTFAKIIEAVQDSKLSEEQLWQIQVAAAQQQMTKGVGTVWRLQLRGPGWIVDVSEETATALEYRMVGERLPGVSLLEMGFDGMTSNPAMIYEFARAHLIVQHGKDPADAETAIGRLEMRSLIKGLQMEVRKPDPKEDFGDGSPSLS